MLEELSEEYQLIAVVVAGLVTVAAAFRCVAKSECVATHEEDDNL